MATTIEAEDEFDLARLATVRAPTLLAGGGRDRFYDHDLFAQTARLIPGCVLEIHPGVGTSRCSQIQALWPRFAGSSTMTRTEGNGTRRRPGSHDRLNPLQFSSVAAAEASRRRVPLRPAGHPEQTYEEARAAPGQPDGTAF